MGWKNEELYVITLKWKNTLKKSYLGGEKGVSGEERFVRALKEVEKVGDAAKSWNDFFSKTVNVFKNHGFEQVDK